MRTVFRNAEIPGRIELLLPFLSAGKLPDGTRVWSGRSGPAVDMGYLPPRFPGSHRETVRVPGNAELYGRERRLRSGGIDGALPGTVRSSVRPADPEWTEPMDWTPVHPLEIGGRPYHHPAHP